MTKKEFIRQCIINSAVVIIKGQNGEWQGYFKDVQIKRFEELADIWQKFELGKENK